MTRRRPVLKILGGFAGVLALLLGGFWLWLSSVGDRRWEELRADVVRRKEAAAQRELTRDPLRGDPLPGCVWTDYMAADALIRATPGAENLLLNLQQKSMGLDLVQARSMVMSLQPALDLLRRGGRHVDARVPVPAPWAPQFDNPPLHRLKMLALCRARIDIDEGRGGEGMAVLLDFDRLSQDAARNGAVMGIARWNTDVEPAFEELRRAVMKGGLPPAAEEALARELDVLDRTGPSMESAMEGFAIVLGDWALEDPGQYIRSRTDVKWVWVYHPRLQAASGYFDFTARLPALVGIDRMSWSQEKAAWEDFDRRSRLLTSIWSKGTLASDVRRNRAQRRLLRTILHRRRTGQWLELDDPFGTTLLHAETETHLRAWSVGQDGVDNGGKGSWKPRDGEDLLLEVPK